MLFYFMLASFPPLIQGTQGRNYLWNTHANSLLSDGKFNFSSSPQEVTAEEGFLGEVIQPTSPRKGKL